MQTYDELIGFDYTSAEEWRGFVEEQILPLHKSVSKIIKLRGDLEQLLGNNLPDLIKDDISIKQILLGGVDESGEYKPNSLAKLYKEALGVSVNPKEWVSLCRQPGIDASEYIKCEFSNTGFSQFIRDVGATIDELLLLAGISSSEVNEGEIKEILENPEKIIEELKIICTDLIGISANHNYHTFFTLNTRCIPRFYIEQAYPKLKGKFEELAGFLGLEPKFVPDVKEEGLRRNYTLWGHKKSGIAALSFNLNYLIWKNLWAFRIIFENIPNLGEQYKSKFIIDYETTLILNNKFYFDKTGINLKKYSGNSMGFRYEEDITFIELSRVVSPYLFSGTAVLMFKNSPEFKYEIKEVGYIKAVYLRETYHWYDFECYYK